MLAKTAPIRRLSLKPIRGEGACSRWPAKRAPAYFQADHFDRFSDCCAAEREQAPSPPDWVVWAEVIASKLAPTLELRCTEALRP